MVFKYIRKRTLKDRAMYDIVYDGKSYGTYTHIEDALHDRDLLVESNWDVGEILSRDEKKNKYYDMDIPDFDKEKEKDSRFIYRQKAKHKDYFFVQKQIDGEVRRFGYYDTFEEAEKVRDDLIKNNWWKNE